MSTTEQPIRPATMPLKAGQRLDQATFHALYEMMPPGTRAELIGGVVSTPSPVGPDHSDAHIPLVVWLAHYARATPGVQPLDNVSTALDELGEPQPDVALRTRPEYGGRTQTGRRHIVGAPELVIEVARASRYIDLGPKLADYKRARVQEYIVRTLDPDEVIWHVLQGSSLTAVSPSDDGIYRSQVFPGLWLDPQALLADDHTRVSEVLNRGLATPEHAEFVARLAKARAHSLRDR